MPKQERGPEFVQFFASTRISHWPKPRRSLIPVRSQMISQSITIRRPCLHQYLQQFLGVVFHVYQCGARLVAILSVATATRAGRIVWQGVIALVGTTMGHGDNQRLVAASLRDLIVTPGQADTVCPFIVAELCLIMWWCGFRLAFFALGVGAHDIAQYR